MPYAIMAAISLHILSAVFWAGTSFTLARTGGAGAAALFRPQMGAALIAVLSGTYLWSRLHEAGFGTTEMVLAVGASCAIAAAGVQGALTGPALRALKRGGNTASQAQPRIAIAQRIGSGLLTVTIIAMATSRYV
jgi:hypothetical protein